MENPLKILLVEDNDTDAMFLEASVKQYFKNYKLTFVKTKKDFLKELKKNYDIIISDYLMPDFNGSEVLKLRNKQRPDIPFIIVTGSMNEETAVACLKAGADDYLIKEHLKRIGQAIEMAIEKKKIEKEKEESKIRLQYLNNLLVATRDLNKIVYNSKDEIILAKNVCDALVGDKINPAVFIALKKSDKQTWEIVNSGFPDKNIEELQKLMNTGNTDFCINKSLIKKGVFLNEITEKKCGDKPLYNTISSNFTLTSQLEHNNMFFGVLVTAIPLKLKPGTEEIAFFEEIASDISFAMYNIFERREKERSEKIRQALFQISEASFSNLDFIDFLGKMHKAIEPLMDVGNFYVALYNKQKNTYDFPYFKDAHDKPVQFKDLERRKGITEYVRKTGKPLFADDAKQKELIENGEIELIGHPAPIWVGVPLKTNSGVIGVLAVQNYSNPDAVSKKDMEVLEYISNHVADVIARKSMYLKQKESEEKFRKIFQTTPDAISLVDSVTNEVLDVNEGFLRMTGYKRNEILGFENRDLQTINNPEDRKKLIDELKEKGSVENMEMAIRTKQNKLITVLVSSSMLELSGRWCYLFISKDIDYLKQSENEIIRAKEKAEESDRLKSEFLANMSHEIRTPMNGIIGFTSLLEEDDVSAEARKNYIQIIINSTKQLLRIIDDILEISKLETKQVPLREREINLNDLMTQIFSVFDLKAKEKNLSLYLHKSLKDEFALIRIDDLKLHKILENLLENALKFTFEGKIEIGYILKNYNILELYVKDSGVGISPENQQIIFERFSQEEKEISRKTGGLGLGLSIAKANTELLGGEISVESVKGSGSKFIVKIPYKPVNKPPKFLNSSSEGRKVHKILIVEDEEINYQYIEFLLKNVNQKFHLLHAYDGNSALNAAKENSDIKLVLMDLKLPGKSGHEVTREIKKMKPDLPVIAQTAYASSDDRKKAMESGCDDFISKPFQKPEFLELINKYLPD